MNEQNEAKTDVLKSQQKSILHLFFKSHEISGKINVKIELFFLK